MQLIIIAGQARVGKTTLAKYIAESSFELGMVPVLLSFAGPLKEEAIAKGYDKETNPDKYRDFCQTFGLLKRDLDPDYWVEKFEESLEEITDKETIDLKQGKEYWERCVIVDDCRYPNEVLLGDKWNGKLIFLSFGTRKMPDPDGEWRQHESESLANGVEDGVDNLRDLFTYIINNDGTIENLKEKARLMTPIWCGYRIEDSTSHNSSSNLNKYIEELLDLLILEQLDEEEEEDTE